MDVNFKSAHLLDVEILVELMQELYEHDNAIFHETPARAALEHLLQHSSLGQVWLIQCDRRAIGYVVLTLGYSLEFRGRDAFVDELYIQADYRRQGIGTQTLRFLEDACRSLGVRALHLEVEHRNIKAQQFYQKVGFTDRNYYLMTKAISYTPNV